jgi:geranylgeranyl diphosphate synthase type II
MANLSDVMQERASLLARYLDFYFESDAVRARLNAALGTRAEGSGLPSGVNELLTSVRYSLLQEGGKRFRPVLTMLAAEALGQPKELVLPFAGAVECIHTYSLIHDDLPAMDNDDFRRGQPTNHKKFNEATAILAGDALLTEAFAMIADNFTGRADVGLRAVSELAKAAGLIGMVGGQAVDMGSKAESISLEELHTMHRLKTGALIRVCATGAAVICGATPRQLGELELYADNLGLAFQVADDILDFDPAKPEPGSYPALLGLESTKKYLAELTESCFESLDGWPALADPLREIATYNQTRSK